MNSGRAAAGAGGVLGFTVATDVSSFARRLIHVATHRPTPMRTSVKPPQKNQSSARGFLSQEGASDPKILAGHFDKFETASSGPTCDPNISSVPRPAKAFQIHPGIRIGLMIAHRGLDIPWGQLAGA